MEIITKNKVKFYQNSAWAGDKMLCHGFFTRVGGYSQGIYQGLNCGTGSGDAQNLVAKNQLLACETLGLDVTSATLETRLFTLYQHHSADCCVVPFAKNLPQADDGRVKGDAMVMQRQEKKKLAKDFAKDGLAQKLAKGDDLVENDFTGSAIAIMTADCVPVLFYEAEAAIIGAAHSGWKGGLSGVLENTIDAIVNLGGKENQIMAAIGPCIMAESYQVGAEFYDEFVRTDPAGKDFFRVFTQNDKYQFNLPAFVRYRLEKAGLRSENITQTDQDTYQNSDLFFSYRRSCHQQQVDYGRNFSLIGWV